MLVFCNTSKRKLSFTFRRSDVLAALPAIPLRDIPATGVRRPCNIPRFARQRHGTHVLLQGRQIAFERPYRHPRTSRRELSGEVRNCHLKPSNRSSDSLNDLLNSSSESIASSSDFIEDSCFLEVAGGWCGGGSAPYPRALRSMKPSAAVPRVQSAGALTRGQELVSCFLVSGSAADCAA